MKTEWNQSIPPLFRSNERKRWAICLFALALGLLLAGALLSSANAAEFYLPGERADRLQATQPPDLPTSVEITPVETLLPSGYSPLIFTWPPTPTSVTPPTEPAPTEEPPATAPAEAAPAEQPAAEVPLVPTSIQAGDLAIRTLSSVDGALPGSPLEITIWYTNTGNSAIANVTISDTLFKLQNYDCTYTAEPAITQDACTGGPSTGWTIRWSIPSLAAHASGTITLHTTIINGIQPQYHANSALNLILTVGNSVDIYAPGITKSSSTVPVVVLGAIFDLKKSATPTSAIPGRLITYTLSLENKARNDCTTATNIVITTTLHQKVNFVSAESGGTYDSTARTVRWNLTSPLACGSTISVRVLTRLTDQVGTASEITNSGDWDGVLQLYKDSKAISSELYKPKLGSAPSWTVKILPTLEKTALDKNRRVAPEAFPTEEITYTLKVHNPTQTALTGVLVTDTLPGEPAPFEYVRSPAGSPVPEVRNGGRNLMWTLDLPAEGSLTFSFVVKIPRQTRINDNAEGQDYFNTKLQASHPSTFFRQETNLAKVKIWAALVMKKTVSPNHAKVGENVVYELSLTNKGPFTFNSVRITDTLPANFTYVTMESGPDPLPDYRNKVIVWELPVPYASVVTLRFQVRVDGIWLQTYGNNVYGYSDDAYIPKLINQANVKVDPSILLNKVVTPNKIFYNEIVEYALTVKNDSNDPWTLAEVRDQLPDGFYQEGGSYGNEAVIAIEPDYVIPAGDTWEGSFQAKAVGGGSLTCNNLPKTFPNAPGAIELQFIAPQAILAYNAAALAPVEVLPHVNGTLTPYRQTVQLGNIVTYTLGLDNVSPQNAPGNTINVVLPAGLQYMSMVQGPAPTVNGQTLTWSNVNVIAGTKVELKFKIQVLPSATLGTKTPTVTTTSAAGICIGKFISGDVNVGMGVNVVDDVIVLKKTSPAFVAPRSLVEYDISIQNKDSYPFPITLIDSLPLGFSYDSMTSGPTPSLTQVRPSDQRMEVIWYNLVIPRNTTYHLKMKARSSNLYGDYTNYLDANSPETIIRRALADKPVTVAPLVDIKKDTPVKAAMPGSTVPYTIILLNLSSMNYTNVLVTDTLPSGFSFVRMQAGSPAPIALGPNKTQPVWKISSLAAGASATLAFETTIGAGTAPNTYYNLVTASSPNGHIPDTGPTAPVVVTNTLVAQFEMFKTTSIHNAIPGDTVPYTITLHNLGTQTYSNVVVTDTLPSGFTFVQARSGTPAPATTGPNNNRPVWSIASIAPGATVYLVFEAKISLTLPTSIYFNQVTAFSPTGAIPPTGATAPVAVTQQGGGTDFRNIYLPVVRK